MMDWYNGSDIEDLVVPKDGELSSPNSWFRWGMNAPQCFGSENKYFTTDSEELNFNGKRSSCYADELGASVDSKDHSKGSSIGGDLFNSLQQSAFSQMDDTFLSTLLDDLPVNESFQKSVCISHPSQSDSKPKQSVSAYMVDSQSNLSDINNTGRKKYARTDGMYIPVGWEDGEVTHCKPEQKDHPAPPVKDLQVEHFSLSEENSTSGYAGEETSLEESVLQDLEIVMTRLTEKTRFCFRDALYRLANSSKQLLADGSQTDDPLIKEPRPSTTHDETIRESETNTIDRAIASLIFSEMESNQEVVPASGQHSYCSSQQDYSSLHHAQVPIHAHRELTLNLCP